MRVRGGGGGRDYSRGGEGNRGEKREEGCRKAGRCSVLVPSARRPTASATREWPAESCIIRFAGKTMRSRPSTQKAPTESCVSTSIATSAGWE